MNAVRADDRIHDCGRAIGKRYSDAIACLVQTYQFGAQLGAFAGNRTGESRVQVATVSQQIRRAELLFGALAENHVEFDFAGSPIPVVPGARVERSWPQPR